MATAKDIFTIRGVGIRLHFSLIFLLLYVFLISTFQFRYVVKTSGMDITQITQSPVLWAVIFSISLVISIFLHEFAHVLVAQAKGASVKRITLMMLGGVSEIESLPDETPATEMKIAIIGPIVSLGLGVALYSMRFIDSFPNLAFFGYWLGQINIGLGIFNLLPAFPTDGGRVLRSLLAAKRGKIRGTEMAVKVSNIFSLMFGVLGFLEFNILLLLIAFFIFSAAKSELFLITAEGALNGLKVIDLMVPSPTIREDQMISEAAQLMHDSHTTSVPVTTHDHGYGIVDAESIQRIPKDYWDKLPVSRVETLLRKAVDADEPLQNALKVAMSSGASGVPVTDHDKIMGVVRMTDISEAIHLRRLAPS